MFLKKLIQTGQTAAKPKMQMFMRTPMTRKFSSGMQMPPTSGFGVAPMMMMGASLAGFAYLGYTIRDMNNNKAAYMAQGHTYMSPLVQKRISHTLGFFSYGVFSTAAGVFYLRNSMIWASIPWYVLLGGSFACMYGAHACDYET